MNADPRSLPRDRDVVVPGLEPECVCVLKDPAHVDSGGDCLVALGQGAFARYRGAFELAEHDAAKPLNGGRIVLAGLRSQRRGGPLEAEVNNLR